MDTKSECCCCKIIKNHTKINYGFKCKCNESFKPSFSSSGVGTLRRRRNTSRDDESRAEMALLPSPSPNRSLSSASSNGQRTKRALLCGVTYKNWKHRLHGTVNDVLNMQDLLINHFGYSKQNIRILTGYISSFCLHFFPFFFFFF